MVVTQLIGGLGNQMFQYAFGRYVSHRLATSLFLDLSPLDLKSPNPQHVSRQYELGVFPIESPIALPKQVAPFFPQGRIDKFFSKLLNKNHVVQEPKADYFLEHLDTYRTKDILLSGYWQNARFFESIGPLIKKDFSYSFTADDINFPLLEIIQKCESVALHVRRGDYVSNSEANKVHGVLTETYYASAIKLLMGKLIDPHFFVFSDDLEWCKVALSFSGANVTFVSNNFGENSFKDMMLMAACKHAIIANSTFSWWGAWLNKHPTKTIVAPAAWFQSNLSQKDIIPSGWIRL